MTPGGLEEKSTAIVNVILNVVPIGYPTPLKLSFTTVYLVFSCIPYSVFRIQYARKLSYHHGHALTRFTYFA